jgi:hypothetical protein
VASASDRAVGLRLPTQSCFLPKIPLQLVFSVSASPSHPTNGTAHRRQNGTSQQVQSLLPESAVASALFFKDAMSLSPTMRPSTTRTMTVLLEKVG